MCFFFLKILFLYAAAMIYSAVTSWRPQLFWLAGRGPALSMLCHLSNLQQSTTPWEKNVNNPKMIERWKVKCDMCMPCYCASVFHKSNVLPSLSFMHYLFASCNVDFKVNNQWVIVFQYLLKNSWRSTKPACGSKAFKTKFKRGGICLCTAFACIGDYNLH